VDINFSILVDVNFAENFMKLVFRYFLSSFLSNISLYTMSLLVLRTPPLPYSELTDSVLGCIACTQSISCGLLLLYRRISVVCRSTYFPNRVPPRLNTAVCNKTQHYVQWHIFIYSLYSRIYYRQNAMYIGMFVVIGLLRNRTMKLRT